MLSLLQTKQELEMINATGFLGLTTTLQQQSTVSKYWSRMVEEYWRVTSKLKSSGYRTRLFGIFRTIHSQYATTLAPPVSAGKESNCSSVLPQPGPPCFEAVWARAIYDRLLYQFPFLGQWCLGTFRRINWRDANLCQAESIPIKHR